MRDGRLQQVATPQRLFREPTNLFVAAFIGSPSMNLVEAEVADGRVRFAGFDIPLAEGGRARPLPARVILGIRPQDFSLVEHAGPSRPTIDVEPVVIEELGSATHVIFPVDAQPVDADEVRAATDEGDTAVLLASDTRALFTAEVPEGTPVRVDRTLRLALDPSRFHFFDLATGEALRSV
jgi:multiple sugar transport system ATP-binding protein